MENLSNREKYRMLFENEDNKTMLNESKFLNTFDEVDGWLYKHDITGKSVFITKEKGQLVVNVYDSVDLKKSNLNEIPVKFGFIKGSFDISNNNLKSLEGCPYDVENIFDCSNNQLKSLKGGPNKGFKEIDDSYICNDNLLTTLEGAPKEVGGYFFCRNNKLTTLEGAPKEVGGGFICTNNNLKSLDGLGSVGKELNAKGNKDLKDWKGAEKVRGHKTSDFKKN
jgi:hypothetical protein